MTPAEQQRHDEAEARRQRERAFYDAQHAELHGKIERDQAEHAAAEDARKRNWQ